MLKSPIETVPGFNEMGNFSNVWTKQENFGDEGSKQGLRAGFDFIPKKSRILPCLSVGNKRELELFRKPDQNPRKERVPEALQGECRKDSTISVRPDRRKRATARLLRRIMRTGADPFRHFTRTRYGLTVKAGLDKDLYSHRG